MPCTMGSYIFKYIKDDIFRASMVGSVISPNLSDTIAALGLASPLLHVVGAFT